jgi:hypothetical protein
MSNQREQYGSTVHLFIGTGCSPCKITSRPFAFDNNSIVIYQGLDSLFLFKSVSFLLPTCRSSLAHSFGSAQTFVFLMLRPTVALIQVRRYLLMYFTPKTLLNHVFEDLRKPKAPNTYCVRSSPSLSTRSCLRLATAVLQFPISPNSVSVAVVKPSPWLAYSRSVHTPCSLVLPCLCAPVAPRPRQLS